MKKIDHKFIKELYEKEIERVDGIANQYHYYRQSRSTKSHKREMKRKLIQLKGSYVRVKKLMEKSRKSKS